MTLSTGTDNLNFSEANVNDKVIISNGDLTADDTIDGDQGTDVFWVDNDTTLVDAAFENVTEMENIMAQDADGVSGDVLNLTLGLKAQAAGIVSVSGGTGDDTINASAYTTGIMKVTAGTGDDNISGEAGADIFVFANANLNSADTISGGAGNDIIQMSDDSVVVDSDFTNATSIHTLTTTGSNLKLTATLGKNAADAGLTQVTLTETDFVNKVTVGSGFDEDLTVTISTDLTAADSVIATNYTKTLTVKAADTSVDDSTNVNTLTGNASAGTEILEVTMSTDSTIQTGNITNWDQITIKSDNSGSDTATITTADALVASGATMTIDATHDTTNDPILTFDGALEADGSFIVKTAGTGAHTVTLGQKNDTYTGTGSGDTTITATGGTNTITTGSGGDTITAGSGTDTLTGGTGSDTFSFGSAANSLGDSITDFSSTDDQIGITLDYSGLQTAVTVNAVRKSAGVAGLASSEALMTGERGEFVYDTTNSLLYVNRTADGSITNADHKISVNAATTAKSVS